MAVIVPDDGAFVPQNDTSGVTTIHAVSPLVWDPNLSNLSIGNASVANPGCVSIGAQSLAGVKNLQDGLQIANGQTITAVSTDITLVTNSDSTLSTQRATKSYIDNKIFSGVSWQQVVKQFYDPTSGLPNNPQEQDRVIASQSGNGWIKNYIYTFLNAAWSGIIPLEGYTVYSDQDNGTFNYNGATWVHIGISIDHVDLQNIGTNTHSQIDGHLSNTTTAHFSQDLKSTATPTFTGLNLVNGGTTGALSTNQYGDVILTASVPDDAYVVLNGFKTEVNGLLAADKLVNKSGLTTTVESDGALGAVILSAVGVGAKVKTMVNDNGLTTTIVEDISSTQKNIYLDTEATNTSDGSVHLAGGMSIVKSIQVGGSINGTSLTIASGDSDLYGNLALLQGNQHIRMASANEATYGSAIIEKYNNTTLSLRNNGRINGDYNAASSGQSIINLNSTGITMATAAPNVTPAVDRMTISGTTIAVLPTTVSSDVSSGALTVGGGCGVNGTVNALDVGVPNASSINTFANTTNKKLSTIISLKAYATGDGVTDDTVGVQNFFNAVTATTTAGVGYIPTGQYKCTSNITVDFKSIQFTGCKIYGDGKNQSTFQMTACQFIWKNSTGPTTYDIGLTDFSVQGTFDGAICDFQNGYRDCYIQNLITYNHSINAAAISCQIYAFIASTMCNCDILGQGAAYGIACLQLINGSGSTFSGIYCARYATALAVGNVSTTFFSGCTFNAMDLEYCGTSVLISNATVTNNVFYGSILGANNTSGINATAGSSNIFITPSMTQAKITSSTGCAIFGSSTATAGTLTVPNLNVGLTGQTLGINFNGNATTTSTLNYYETFSEIKTFSTGNNTCSVTCSYVRVGKSVTMTLVQGILAATANSSISCASCVPTRFLPGTTVDQNIICTQNSNISQGRIIVAASTGTVTCWRDQTSNFPNNSAVCTIGSSTVVHYQTA